MKNLLKIIMVWAASLGVIYIGLTTSGVSERVASKYVGSQLGDEIKKSYKGEIEAKEKKKHKYMLGSDEMIACIKKAKSAEEKKECLE